MSRIPDSLAFQIAHAQGSADEVARRFGVCPSTVLRARRVRGVRRKAGVHVPPEDIEQIRAMRREGKSFAEITTATGYCDTFIWKHTRDIPYKRKDRNAEAKALAIELRRSGKMFREIQKQVKFPIPTLWNWCENARANPPPKVSRRNVRRAA